MCTMRKFFLDEAEDLASYGLGGLLQTWQLNIVPNHNFHDNMLTQPNENATVNDEYLYSV